MHTITARPSPDHTIPHPPHPTIPPPPRRRTRWWWHGTGCPGPETPFPPESLGFRVPLVGHGPARRGVGDAARRGDKKESVGDGGWRWLEGNGGVGRVNLESGTGDPFVYFVVWEIERETGRTPTNEVRRILTPSHQSLSTVGTTSHGQTTV